MGNGQEQRMPKGSVLGGDGSNGRERLLWEVAETRKKAEKFER